MIRRALNKDENKKSQNNYPTGWGLYRIFLLSSKEELMSQNNYPTGWGLYGQEIDRFIGRCPSLKITTPLGGVCIPN